jgi:endonuclease YncB( thermonuclease family)
MARKEKVTVELVTIDDYGRVVAKVKKGNNLVSTLMKKHQKKK